MSKTYITKDLARAILTAPGYDAYGATRIYGVVAEGIYKGQTVAIKSEQTLNGNYWSKIYTKATSFNDLVKGKLRSK